MENYNPPPLNIKIESSASNRLLFSPSINSSFNVTTTPKKKDLNQVAETCVKTIDILANNQNLGLDQAENQLDGRITPQVYKCLNPSLNMT
ncbi:hypothetical protein PV325_010028 [Microctonus aethiopoides]|nr:hypothetical protein PV325_010028 [Microctonus aethiopoides]